MLYSLRKRIKPVDSLLVKIVADDFMKGDQLTESDPLLIPGVMQDHLFTALGSNPPEDVY